ncbi:MAG: hypothetical protein D6793_01330 [Thermoflexia bacterium]|nr:MAG: hypothetical protein D6793_01330 [Thermoflexia bacterium]
MKACYAYASAFPSSPATDSFEPGIQSGLGSGRSGNLPRLRHLWRAPSRLLPGLPGPSTSRIALASAIYAVWNALNDPIFGYITDSTRSRRGRRIPYMRYTAPLSGPDLHPGLDGSPPGRSDRTLLVDADHHR